MPKVSCFLLLILSFAFYVGCSSSEKIWEQNGFSGDIALSPDGQFMAVSVGNDISIMPAP